ncbi:phage replisome organizer protein [Lactococcus petauri]|uniref:phage replisome organizer protein n=1 Tax=Lactococcus petauri TaxID=1940789 RepID=UPI0022E48BEE|nr:phage replisome organiser protein [Lactococcus petauri]
MAKKRMFNQEVVRSDEFLDLPSTSQLLYFHFGMIADDDGIVASVERELRYLGFGSRDDINILINKNFIDVTTDGKLIFIIHWLKNNNLRSDRYNRTTFLEAREELGRKGYKFKGRTFGIQDGIPNDTQSAATDKELDIGLDKNKNKESKKGTDSHQETDDLFSLYFSSFKDFSKKNISRRAMAQKSFLDLPPFQREEALTGAKNYIEWYKNENPEDIEGKFSINAYEFLRNMAFMDYQKKPDIKPKTLGGFC